MKKNPADRSAESGKVSSHANSTVRIIFQRACPLAMPIPKSARHFEIIVGAICVGDKKRRSSYDDRPVNHSCSLLLNQRAAAATARTGGTRIAVIADCDRVIAHLFD